MAKQGGGLKISPKNKVPGLFVYCNACKSGSRKWKCDHPEKQVYKLKVHIPGTDHGRQTRVLDTRSEEKAIKMAVNMKDNLKVAAVMPDKIIRVAAPTLPNLVMRFIDYNENPPKNHKPNSPATIADYELHLKKLIDFLIKKGVDPGSITADRIDERLAHLSFESIKTGYSGRTQHKYFKTYSNFCEYLIDQGIISRNPFKGWRFEETVLQNEVILQQHFIRLLQEIDADHPKTITYGDKKARQVWYPWLKDAFCLGLFSGARRQEIPVIKWTDVMPNRNTGYLQGGVLILKDIKNTAIQKLDVVKMKPIEINDDLSDLLYSMGYEQYHGLSRYLIDGEERWSRSTIINACSRGFDYYIKFVPETSPTLSFKCLRKTYFTNGFKAVGDHVSLMGGHSTKEVTAAHYINQLEAVNAAGKYRRIFGESFKIPTSIPTSVK